MKALIMTVLKLTLSYTPSLKQLQDLETKIENMESLVFRRDSDGLFYFKHNKESILVDLNCDSVYEKKFVFYPLINHGIFVIDAPINGKDDKLKFLFKIFGTYGMTRGSHLYIKELILKLIKDKNSFEGEDGEGKIFNAYNEDLPKTNYAAGEICIKQGEIIWFTNKSGGFTNQLTEKGFDYFIKFITKVDNNYSVFKDDVGIYTYIKNKENYKLKNVLFASELKTPLKYNDNPDEDKKTIVDLNCDNVPGSFYSLTPKNVPFIDFPLSFFVKGLDRSLFDDKGKQKEEKTPNIFNQMQLNKFSTAEEDVFPFIKQCYPLIVQNYKLPDDHETALKSLTGGICVKQGVVTFISNYTDGLDQQRSPKRYHLLADFFKLDKYLSPDLEEKLMIKKKEELNEEEKEKIKLYEIIDLSKKVVTIWGKISEKELKTLLAVKDKVVNEQKKDLI